MSSLPYFTTIILTVLTLVGCATDSQITYSVKEQKPVRDPSGQVISECEDVGVYMVSDAHPGIRWLEIEDGNTRESVLGCLLSRGTDAASIELKEAMSSGLYEFVRECKKSSTETYRLFKYKNSKVPYLLRLHSTVDAYTYVVVLSLTRPNGSKYHRYFETGNFASSVESCPPE